MAGREKKKEMVRKENVHRYIYVPVYYVKLTPGNRFPSISYFRIQKSKCEGNSTLNVCSERLADW